MEHTYFLHTVVWRASGTYYDAEGRSFLLMGEVQVRRTASEWTLAGTLTVRSDPPVQFSNSYRIARTETPDTLCWESYNPALGTLRGTFEIVGPCIVSISVSYTHLHVVFIEQADVVDLEAAHDHALQADAERVA